MPRLHLAGLALVMVLVTASPALAAPRWLKPTLPFDSVPARQGDASAVMTADGTVVFARFAPGGALEVRERPPGGPVGPTITIPPVTVQPQPSPNLELLAGPDGTVAVLFDAGAARYASLRAPGGRWRSPEVIGLSGRAGAGQAQVAPDGVLWSVGRTPQRDDALVVTRLSPDGRAGVSPLPTPANGARDLAPVLTASRAETAHVVYLERAPADEHCTSTTAVLAVDVPARGDVGPATTLDTAVASGEDIGDGCELGTGTLVLAPLLSADAAGADTIVYSAVSLESLAVTVLARHRDSGGAWQPEETVSTADAVAEKLIGGAGAPLVVVRAATGKSIATRGPDGTWTPLAPLIGLEDASSYDAARTGEGTTVFAWVESTVPARVVGRVADATGALGEPTPLVPAIEGAALLAVGGDAEGNAAALASQPQGDAFVLRLHAYDAAGPRVTSLTVPERGGANAPLAFDVTGLDVWSGPAISGSWDFGDGETARGLGVEHAYTSGGDRTVRTRLQDASGNATTVSRALTITAAPPLQPAPLPVPASPPAPTRDTRAPLVSGVSISPRSPRAGRPASLAVTADEAGRLTVVLSKVAPGVRRGTRCVARASAHGRRCTRTLARRSVSRTVGAGTRRVPLPRLSAGTWTVTATVTDAAGNASRARSLKVRVA